MIAQLFEKITSPPKNSPHPSPQMAIVPFLSSRVFFPPPHGRLPLTIISKPPTALGAVAILFAVVFFPVTSCLGAMTMGAVFHCQQVKG
jgi:hypothetical protein